MASSDKELEQQLMEAGNKLVSSPSSVDELLTLLDQVESCLSKVEQSPTKSMQSALAPSLKALAADQLFKHSNVDVKVAVASCISEITRITAPDAPYDDDHMKDVFQLIVSSFENLSDKSSRSYSKRTSILETVAKVRSCVVMLDLECDALITEMFQHFLISIRDYHPDNVFSSMETIMTLVLEESEDIPLELLSPLLASVKKGNEEVLPDARKLGEKVLESCANKVKPYLQQAVKSLGISLDDYSDIIASICEEVSSVEQIDAVTVMDNRVEESKPVVASSEEAAQAGNEVAAEAGSPELPEATNDKSPKSAVSNGVAQTCEGVSLVASSSLKKADDSNHADQSKSTDSSSNGKPDIMGTDKLANDETKPEEANKKTGRKVNSVTELAGPSESSHIDTEKEAQESLDDKNHGKNIPSSPHGEPAVEAAVSSENKEVADASQPSSPKVQGESVTVASASEGESVPEETLSKKAGQSKMESSKKDFEPSSVDDSRKAYEGTSDSEANPSKRSKESLTKDPEPSSLDAARKAYEGTSDSEAKPNKRSRKAPSRVSPGEKTPAKISNEEKAPTTDVSNKEADTTGESDTKPLKWSSEKVGAGSNNGDGSSLDPIEDKKQRSRRKSISEKSVVKSSTKDDDKVSTPKSAAKLTKDGHQLETPKIDSKRKRSGIEKESNTEDDGTDLVGMKVKVWWPLDRQFYEGRVDSYDPEKKKHRVLYDDGDEEILNLKRQKWEIIQDSLQDAGEATEPQSPEVLSETPPKKHAKTNSDQSAKQGKVENSKGGASSSKSKSASTKSGARKSKEAGKTDSKSTDDSKVAKKVEDDNVGKTKDNTSKSGSKSADVTSKTSGKSKNDDVSTSKSSKSSKEDRSETPKTSNKSKQEITKAGGKSKQETPKVTSNVKNKSPKSGSKSSINGTGKLKSGSAKVREIEDDEDPTDSGQPQENTKAIKSQSSSKGQGSEGKSGKKRRRA